MRIELQALQRILSASQVGESFAKLVFGNLTPDLEASLGNYLEGAWGYYNQCHQITEVTGPINDQGAKLEALTGLMPTALFVFADKLVESQAHSKLFLRMLVAAADIMLFQHINNEQLSKAVLAAFNPNDDLETLKEKTNNSSNRGYLVRILKQDLVSLASLLLKFPEGKTRQDRVEMLFFFRALTAIFFRFYFNLLANAPKDDIARHIDQLFNPFFIALRRFEIIYFVKGNFPQSKLDYIIERDDANLRHPLLRKHVFGMVMSYNPLLNDGKQQNFNVTGQKLLRMQMERLKAMSTLRLSLMFSAVRRYRGKAFLLNLLSALQRVENDKIFALRDYLHTCTKEDEQELYQEVVSYLARIGVGKLKPGQAPPKAPPKPQMTWEAQRKLEAKRNIEANKNRNMMNQFQVEDYLRSRLAKLYEKVRKEGALTQDKIPEYLAMFAEASKNVIHDRELTDDEINAFEESTSEILDQIADEAELDRSHFAAEKEAFKAQAQMLRVADTAEERAEIVSDIGVKLSDVQNRVEQKQKADDWDAFFQSEIIAIGLEENAPRIPLGEFFAFPLGQGGQVPAPENLFEMHLRYIEALLQKGKLKSQEGERIQEGVGRFSRYRYKKYFDIFPGESYEDTVMMAVFSLWENKALEKLREKL